MSDCTCYCDGTAHSHRRDYCGITPTPHPDDMTEKRRVERQTRRFVRDRTATTEGSE